MYSETKGMLVPYPLHNAKHGHLVLDIEAQKHGVPGHIPQPLDSVEVPNARGILVL